MLELLLTLLPLCETESSTVCYWEAQTLGNGLGSSFIALWESVVLYV